MDKEICKNMLCTPFVISFMTLVCKQHSSQKLYFALMQTVTNGQRDAIRIFLDTVGIEKLIYIDYEIL